MTGYGWRAFEAKKFFSVVRGWLGIGKNVFYKQTADLLNKVRAQ